MTDEQMKKLEKLQLERAIERAGRERDEARAEVERLEGNEQAACEMAFSYKKKAEEAYRRGAEAMREACAREACAREVGGYSVTVTDPLGRRVALGADGLGALADAIRALPLPEEK